MAEVRATGRAPAPASAGAAAAAPAPAAPVAVDADDDEDAFDDDLEDDAPPSFLQLQRPGDRGKRKQALQLLAARATALKSRTLSTLLLKLRDAPTPFQKVAAWIFVFRMHWFFADHFFPPVPPTATQRSFSALRLIFVTE